MSTPAPPPPKLNAKFVDAFGKIHIVRAIVDYVDTPEGPNYCVVFRFRSVNYPKEWRYSAESCHALTYGVLKPFSRKKRAR